MASSAAGTIENLSYVHELSDALYVEAAPAATTVTVMLPTLLPRVGKSLVTEAVVAVLAYKLIV